MSNSSSWRPADFLGVELLGIEGKAEFHKQSRNRLRLGNQPDAYAPSTMKLAIWLAKQLYMRGRWRDCAVWCRKVGEDAHYCFLGDWMICKKTPLGTIDPRYWYDEAAEYWTAYYLEALGWCALGRCWDQVEELMAFLRPSLVVDRDGPCGRAFALGLGEWWKDREYLAWVDEAKAIRSAGSKHYHLLADVAAAITGSETKAITKAFTAHVRHFLKRRYHTEHFPMEAVFLRGVAERDGVDVDLAPEIGKYVLRIPDEAFSQQE